LVAQNYYYRLEIFQKPRSPSTKPFRNANRRFIWLLERTKFTNRGGKDGNACIQYLQTKLQDLNNAFKTFSITTSKTSDSNRNKNIVHYIKGKPTDYGIKNVLINSRFHTIRRAAIIRKIYRIFNRYVLTVHTDGFSCDSILRTRHNVS
jgi:hypothetical protein